MPQTLLGQAHATLPINSDDMKGYIAIGCQSGPTALDLCQSNGGVFFLSSPSIGCQDGQYGSPDDVIASPWAWLGF